LCQILEVAICTNSTLKAFLDAAYTNVRRTVPTEHQNGI